VKVIRKIAESGSWDFYVSRETYGEDGMKRKRFYYFDENGIMPANTMTPDGYQVNEKSEWVENGVVRLKDQATINIERMAKPDESRKQAEQALQDSLRKCSDDISAYAGEYTDGIYWSPSYTRMLPMGSSSQSNRFSASSFCFQTL